jgi:hypothetical protein
MHSGNGRPGNHGRRESLSLHREQQQPQMADIPTALHLDTLVAATRHCVSLLTQYPWTRAQSMFGEWLAYMPVCISLLQGLGFWVFSKVNPKP